MKVRFNKKTAIVMGIVVMMLALAVPAMACTSIVVGKLASADGSVMTTHTCDGTYEFRLNIVPAGLAWGR